MDKLYIHRLFLMPAVCGLCLGVAASCSLSDWHGDNGSGEEVRLFAQIGEAVTRMNGNTWEGGERIGVLADNGQRKVYTVENASGSMVAEDEPFIWEGDEFGLKAWYPYTDGAIDLTDQSAAAGHYGCDLLYSEAVATDSRSVNFQFSHQMTCVWWMLQNAPEYTPEEIANAQVYFYGYGSVSNADGKISPVGKEDRRISTYRLNDNTGQAMMVPGEVWDKPLIEVVIGGDTYLYTPTHGNDTDNRNTGVLKPNTMQQYYLQISREQLTVSMESVAWDGSETVGEDAVKDSKFKVNIPAEVSGLDDYDVIGVDENGYISDAATGFSVTYRESEPSGGLYHDGLCDRHRTADAGAGTVTFSFTDVRSDISLSHTLEYMEVGYYFYNDGTYGPDYDAEKTVGVIFGIGKHSTDDVSLYDGKISEIHGYVVALSDEPGTYIWSDYWTSAESDLKLYIDGEYPEAPVSGGNTTKYIGYANTEYLIDKVSEWGKTVPAASASVSKNESCPVNNTSGWYLPSHAQLKDVATLAGMTILNYTHLTGNYWVSTLDNDNGNAYQVAFDSDGFLNTSVNFFAGIGAGNKVRPILTF